MLVQWSRSTPARESRSALRARAGANVTSFEAELRRDLASATVVSYEPAAGGAAKRLADIVISLLLAPLWLSAGLVIAAVVKVRNRAPVLTRDERIGYGGRAFQCWHLRIALPSAAIVQLHPQAEEAPAPAAPAWSAALEQLPRFINVLTGDMSLVGPAPLTRDAFDALGVSRKFYASARPGLFGLRAEPASEEIADYKLYVKDWAAEADFQYASNALRRVFKGAPQNNVG